MWLGIAGYAPERQEAGVGMNRKGANLVGMMSEERGHVSRGRVSQADPDDLRREPSPDAEALEVLIFRDDHESLGARELPDGVVRGTRTKRVQHM